MFLVPVELHNAVQNAWLEVCGRDLFNCHADSQEVSKCHTTDEEIECLAS